jgi:hypothetical protein
MGPRWKLSGELKICQRRPVSRDADTERDEVARQWLTQNKIAM